MPSSKRLRSLMPPLAIQVNVNSTHGEVGTATPRTDSPPPLSPTLPEPVKTPVHARFATSTLPPPLPSPKPIKVAAVPRYRTPSRSRSLPVDANLPVPPASPSSVAMPAPPPPVAAAPAAPPLAFVAAREPPRQELRPTPEPQPALEDGPLFRAHLASLERRATSLRSSLKKLGRALEASHAALQATLAAQATVDEALDDMSAGAGGLMSGSETLGGLFERDLKAARELNRRRIERDVDRGREMGERVKGAVDRIKGVEERRKAFEGESKRYYEELAKYLGRGESDTAKVAALDARQADRAASFRQYRGDYFSFVEGLVASEEHAVETWLRTWADVQDDELSKEPFTGRPDRRMDAREPVDEAIDHGALSDGAGSVTASASGMSAFSQATSPSIPSTAGNPTLPPVSHEDSDKSHRRRRTSLPHWGLGPAPHTAPAGSDREREAGSDRKRDRFKGFLKTSLAHAQNSLSSALPTSNSSNVLFSPSADAFSRSAPAASASATPPTSSSVTLAVPASMSAPYPSSTQPRKKEGFLYATEVGQKHSTSGDGGARYNRYWVVLSEGQLVEYDRWTDALSVHGTPINLRYATARASKQAGERRFCFEVLTPQLRRVFQATSEQECADWVAAISRSVESLLNGTSSVRHFDSAHLNGATSPYSHYNDFGSSLSLATGSTSHPSPTSELPPLPTSPKHRLNPFLSRHTSLGHSRKGSASGLSKKDKRRSQQSPPVPSLTIGEEEEAPADRAFFDTGSRRGAYALSEGSVATPLPQRPLLDGLGIPFPSLPTPRATSSLSPFSSNLAASHSSPNLLLPRSRSTTSPSEGGSDDVPSDLDDLDCVSILSVQDRAISDAVKGWASSANAESRTQEEREKELMESKFRNAVRAARVAESEELGNQRCADCRAREPRWASWSLGIVLCIRCSGIHRSLGTHISKVRSIELDDWSDEQLALMESIGNAHSNAFFEAEMPPGTVEALTDSTVAPFVKQKYVEKRWIPVPSSGGPSSSATFSSFASPSTPSLPNSSTFPPATSFA
ncbi:hypothetical protein JCM21900_001045 [Sporobolomyces salmonicolor]